MVCMLVVILISMKTVTYNGSFANNDSSHAPLTLEADLIALTLQMEKGEVP